MIIKKYIIISIIFFNCFIFSQSNTNEFKEGKVGYTSSQFIYVLFNNTNGVNEGDTIFTKVKNKFNPALIVKFISSSSAACEKINNEEFKKDLPIFAKIENHQETVSQTEDTLMLKSSANVITVDETKNITTSKKVIEHNNEFSGRYSVQSYTGFSNLDRSSDYLRWRHSLLLGIRNIAGSSLSFSTYSMLAYRVSEWTSVSSNLGKAFKVYEMNLNYQFDESTNLWVGRYLNRKISNLSVVDGAQFEKSFSFLTFGLVAGSRPNFIDFGINTKLFEYGIYFNRADSIGSGLMENTLSFFEQTNDFKTDRRFVYFQHNNNFLYHTSLFASAEVDLYKVQNGLHKNDLSLTSLYLSARYTPINEISFNLSYDARKNVIYYETFKSLADSVLENETRQGFRARTVIRPWNNIYLSFQYGYRYSKSDAKPSSNYGGSIAFNTIPFIEASTTFDFNRLKSNYVDGYIYSVNLDKYFTDISSDFSIGFRKTEYSFFNNSSKLDEKAILLNFSTSVFRLFSFSISYEGVFESVRTFNRVLIDLTTRF
ncbi:MAG TPA: hypothetical protein PKD67_03370 [Ignavibacteriaceae bacterium]|nr:hypothetical protein [Ignavibacteriaceae bacterium]